MESTMSTHPVSQATLTPAYVPPKSETTQSTAQKISEATQEAVSGIQDGDESGGLGQNVNTYR